jgi:hypothetical protein
MSSDITLLQSICILLYIIDYLLSIGVVVVHLAFKEIRKESYALCSFVAIQCLLGLPVIFDIECNIKAVLFQYLSLVMIMTMTYIAYMIHKIFLNINTNIRYRNI